MGECGPDFTVRLLDACTGNPLAGTVQWTSLGPFPAYPGGPLAPCAVQTAEEDVADSLGIANIVGLWMHPSGISTHRVRGFFSTSGESDFRYNEIYLDNTMVGTIDFPLYPVGNCPPAGDPGGVGSGSCSACGEVNVITGPRSTWPMGANRPEGWAGMGNENPADRCTASQARIVDMIGACFPGVNWLPLQDAASVYGAGGTAPQTWNQPSTVETEGSATASMIQLLLQNQAYLSTQLFYCMIALENQGVWMNDFNVAMNARLRFMNESIQLLGTALHGEGWCDRVNCTREDPYTVLHPPFGEGP